MSSAVDVLQRIILYMAKAVHRIQRALRVAAQRMSGVDMSPQLVQVLLPLNFLFLPPFETHSPRGAAAHSAKIMATATIAAAINYKHPGLPR